MNATVRRNTTTCDTLCNTLPDLTPKQARALDALTLGLSVTEAAKQARVSRQTLSQWIHHNQEFRRAYDLRRRETWQTVGAKVLIMVDRALGVLGEDLGDPAERRLRQSAAIAVLRLVGPQSAVARPPAEDEEPVGERVVPLPVFGPEDPILRATSLVGGGLVDAEDEDEAVLE